jgi:hypothetical protein
MTMPDDLNAIHADDQRREHLRRVACDVAIYYVVLVECGVPADTAGFLASNMQDRLIVTAMPETARAYERGEDA